MYDEQEQYKLKLARYQQGKGAFPSKELYWYEPDGKGGVNYFYQGKPIQNWEYRNGTGGIDNTDEIEAVGGMWREVPKEPVPTYTTATTNPSYSNNIAQYDTAISQTKSAMDRLQNQLGIARDNIGATYRQNSNSLQSGFDRAKNTYNQDAMKNQQSLRSNKNTIVDQASGGLRGLMRTLGAYNALGGSDMANASRAVQDEATRQNNGAGYTFAQNQQALDTNWGNYQEEAKSRRQQLDDWQTQQMNNAQAQSEATKQSLLNKLAELVSQRAAYAGGNSRAAAQPYLDQANELSASIDNLSRLNPTYTGAVPIYNAPALSTYNTGGGAGITIGGNAPASNSPILNYLLGLDKDKRILV